MVPGFICWWLGSVCISCNSVGDGSVPIADLLVSKALVVHVFSATEWNVFR